PTSAPSAPPIANASAAWTSASPPAAVAPRVDVRWRPDRTRLDVRIAVHVLRQAQDEGVREKRQSFRRSALSCAHAKHPRGELVELSGCGARMPALRSGFRPMGQGDDVAEPAPRRIVEADGAAMGF